MEVRLGETAFDLFRQLVVTNVCSVMGLAPTNCKAP